ncbi:hypothetical protein XH93_25890 [Bradyrhizobium sp. CCBAU 51753]|nr:hypothetical protein XH93_25890 [Bradyrhizobium sp. CCBAU 51753]
MPMVAMIISVCFARAAPIAASMAILGPGAIGPQPLRPAAPAEDGDKPAFLSFARNAAASRQGKKAGAAVAGRRSRPLPPPGLDQPNRDCVGGEPMTELTDMTVATAACTA